MSRLDRYFLREILVPLAVSIVVVVVAVFLFQARRLAAAAFGLGLTAGDALTIFVAALPPFLVLAIPIAYLLSVLIAFGRLGSDLEIMALRALGCEPARLARVPLALGVVVSLSCIPIAFFGEPYGLRILHDRLIKVALQNLTHAIRPGVFNEDFRGSAVYAAASDERGHLQNILLFDERDSERRILITSAGGEFKTSDARSAFFALERGEMHFAVSSTTAEEPKSYDRVSFSRASLGLDAEGEIWQRTKFVSEIARMTGREMIETVRALGPDDAFSRRVEKGFWRRFAFPSMAFVFGMAGVAIGLGMTSQTKARSAIIALLTVIGYFVLTRIADRVIVLYSDTPFSMVWLPNVIVCGAAALALARSGRPR